MTLFDAVILAIVEGITEYLPVSSTAHISLAASLLKLQEGHFLNSFNIIIQLAPILSVMIIFRHKLSASIEIWKRLIIAFIPVGIVGFLLADSIDALFSLSLIPYWMIATGLLFIFIEYYIKEKPFSTSDVEACSYKQAFTVGIFQIFSLIPGISRSGSTILGAMLLGFSREAAMSFSFLLAIPTMGAASGYTLLKSYSDFDFSQVNLLILGFIVSFVVGYIAVKLLLAFIARYTFIPFGVYLILSGLLFLSF